jgi:hypothetical protein
MDEALSCMEPHHSQFCLTIDIQVIITVLGRRRNRNKKEIRIDLSKCDFYEYEFGGHFDKGIFNGTHFYGAKVWDNHFEGAEIRLCHFDGVNITNSYFEATKMNNVFFTNIKYISAFDYRNSEEFRNNIIMELSKAETLRNISLPDHLMEIINKDHPELYKRVVEGNKEENNV